jgi:3-phosphoshikimate 1-carboxyvinyltransferase
LAARRSTGLSGRIDVPGDKSLSHRALMLGALAIGETEVVGLLEGEDVLATAAACKALGAETARMEDGRWRILGAGLGGLVSPANVVDMGNAGTGCRLLMGIVAGHPITATFTGDASLSRRPMRRVMAPLQQMGARFTARDGEFLPITVEGAAEPMPIEYRLPVASAQVKSAVLLAGLMAPGETVVVEPEPTRDHTERMLAHFGAEIAVEDTGDGGRRVRLIGEPELRAADVRVPGDISSAAFPLVAALIVPGSRVELAGVGLNPLRSGLIDTLTEMGATIRLENARDEAGEPVADLVVESSALKGVVVPARRAPSMIDEYPVLAMAAACADGTTRMEGIGELRVKESDRLAAVARGLEAAGVAVRAGDDWLEVDGTGRPPKGGASVATDLDHRIAMAFLVLGLAAENGMAIDDAGPIATSFPGFAELIGGLGGEIEEPAPA